MALVYGFGFWLASLAAVTVIVGVVMKNWLNGKW